MGPYSRLFDRASTVKDLRQIIAAGNGSGHGYPLASRLVQGIPHYNVNRRKTPSQQHMSEWHHALSSGPGIVVLSSLVQESYILRAEKCVQSIAAAEQENAKGDHFAAPGTNIRIWNFAQKHAVADPAGFINYYAQPWLSAIAAAWLGPGYTLTSQLNSVKPGGKAQVPHRDYHLGFQNSACLSQYPKTIHEASQHLTIQGAIAHGQVNGTNGATKLLPHSQKLHDGFLRIKENSFCEYMEENYIQLSLNAGDGLFFNPALFHAAGENHSVDCNRTANLLQISSSFGKPMEKLNRMTMIQAIYTELLQSDLSDEEKRAVVEIVAEGYSFPTNLDRDQPKEDGSMPTTQQDIVTQALNKNQDFAELLEQLQFAYWRAEA